MATKPNARLEYTIAALAGAGGSVVVDPFATPDLRGNSLGGGIPCPGNVLPPIKAEFVGAARAASGNPGLVTVNKTTVITSEMLTGLTVTLANLSAGAGDTVSGSLYIEVANQADIVV